MKIDPYVSDEPMVCPSHPGLTLVRLSRLMGALRRTDVYADFVPSLGENLASTRNRLQEALENEKNVGTAFGEAQKAIRDVYAHCLAQEPELRAKLISELDFPNPDWTGADKVRPIDVSTVVVTHFKPIRQVFTTIAFDEAHGATAYWLHEEQRVGEYGVTVEAVVENWAPQFTRIRLPIGKHKFYIESRDSSYSVFSEPFEIEVPQL